MTAATHFGNHAYATQWMEAARWGIDGITCPHCDGSRCSKSTHPTMPYHCKDCRKFFSIKTGTPLADSKLPIEKWLMALYLDLTNLKGVSSVKLSRDLNTRQETAWYLLHRIREPFITDEPPAAFKSGREFQIDEAYIGGLEANKHAQDKIPGGQGGATKMIVIGITEKASGKIWADVITDTRAETIAEVIHRIVPEGATIHTDDAKHYGKVQRDRKAVNHSIGEYVRIVDAAGSLATATTNNTESAWSMLKRSITGIHHKMSPKHLRRYVKSFAGRWNIRGMDTEHQMRHVMRKMLGCGITYSELTADNGLPSGSREGGAYFPERRRRYQRRSGTQPQTQQTAPADDDPIDDEIPF